MFLCEEPYGGSIRFGKRELASLSLREVAGTVGYLGHDPELSADTVQNNVLCGSKQDALPYLAATALKEEVLSMENGVETVIGTSGIRLSGGQAQRLRRWTKGYTIKQPNMDCQPTEITALMRHRAVFS